MTTITTSCDTVQQVSSRDPANIGFVLSVIAKRTYTVAPGGTCVPAEVQLPLTTSLVTDPEDANLLLADIDVLPLKPKTDVVVLGHAHAPKGQTTRGMEARVRVAGSEKTILVVGDRRCALSATGGILISAAEPFEKMPVSFARAYGGRDRAAEAKHGNPLEPLQPFLQGTGLSASNQSPYLYPRNPCGRGYLIEPTAEALDALRMPNLEDPQDQLTPARLAVGKEDRWLYMPVPQGLGWMHWGWFPRALFGGFSQEFAKEDTKVPEVARGWFPRGLLDRKEDLLRENVFRFANGAPLDMQFPHLAGDEAIELTNIHPADRVWKVRLPGRPKTMSVDGRDGKLLSTTPVLQTVILEPDHSRVSLVWRGTAPAKRPYFPHELPTMPLLVAW